MSKVIRNIDPNKPGPYFQGRYKPYGRYQWCIKYYDWKNDSEIETAQNWAFGQYNYRTGEFEHISELLGRPIEASIQGRSGGWLVIDTELTDDELEKVDVFIKNTLAELPEFLKDERAYHKEMENDEEKFIEDLKKNEKVVAAVDLLRDFAGPDFVLMIKGVRVK